jgi:hypothetical protein
MNVTKIEVPQYKGALRHVYFAPLIYMHIQSKKLVVIIQAKSRKL